MGWLSTRRVEWIQEPRAGGVRLPPYLFFLSGFSPCFFIVWANQLAGCMTWTGGLFLVGFLLPFFISLFRFIYSFCSFRRFRVLLSNGLSMADRKFFDILRSQLYRSDKEGWAFVSHRTVRGYGARFSRKLFSFLFLLLLFWFVWTAT